MCRICCEYALDKLTWDEAWNNAKELTDDEHRDDLMFTLLKDTESDETI